MYCQHCGTNIEQGAQFCQHCGNPTSSAPALTKPTNTAPLIKCVKCGYDGQPEAGRNPAFVVLAWICIFFAPMLTLLYFACTDKYQCPKCKSTFIEIQNKKGVYVPQKTRMRSTAILVLWILVIVAVIGVVASIILAALNNAREKVRQQTEATQTNQTTDTPDKLLFEADYNEGYKAGYTDGRSQAGQLGDNYIQPASEERREPYTLGYLEGFVKGCREGNFDCRAVEQKLQEVYASQNASTNNTDVQFIPNATL